MECIKNSVFVNKTASYQYTILGKDAQSIPCAIVLGTLFMPDFKVALYFQRHYSGLRNLHGVTCYMNSTLQCLRAIPELKETIKRSPPPLSCTIRVNICCLILIYSCSYPDNAEGAWIDGAHHDLTLAARDIFLRLDQSDGPVKTEQFFEVRDQLS